MENDVNNPNKSLYRIHVLTDDEKHDFEVNKELFDNALKYFHRAYPLGYGFVGFEVCKNVLHIKVIEKNHANDICRLLDFPEPFLDG